MKIVLLLLLCQAAIFGAIIIVVAEKLTFTATVTAEIFSLAFTVQ